MLIVICDMKGFTTTDFLEQEATVKSGFYCQLLRQNSLYLLNDPRRNINIIMTLIYEHILPILFFTTFEIYSEFIIISVLFLYLLFISFYRS